MVPVPQSITTITSATRPIEPMGLALVAAGAFTWYLDLRILPYVLLVVGAHIHFTSLTSVGRTLRLGPSGLETATVRLAWAEIASFNVERGWYHQYVAVRPVQASRIVLPAPRTVWFRQRSQFNADVAQLAAASQEFGGPAVHRSNGGNRTRAVALLLGLAILLLFDRPWYWVRLYEYAAPLDACAVLASAQFDVGGPAPSTKPMTVGQRSGWSAAGCEGSDGTRLTLLVAERHKLMSGTGVAASELNTLAYAMSKDLRELVPPDHDFVLELAAGSGYNLTIRAANVLVTVGPVVSLTSAAELADSAARHL